MVTAPSIDALRSALAPVEALRGEQSQLETWVRESFTALDSLHGELSEWQRELTRQQAAIDQREAALADARAGRGDAEVEAIELGLARAREETRQLEEENAEQLQTLDDLDRQLSISQTELRVVRKHADELSVALETQRERAADEHRHWTAELKELRRLMERQGAMLERLVGTAPPAAGNENHSAVHDAAVEAGADADNDQNDAAARTAELRRRANSRRAAHRREP